MERKIKLLTNQQPKSYKNTNVCYIFIENFEDKYVKDKKYCKVRDHCHYVGQWRDAAHSICSLKFSVPNEIPIVFHSESSYDYHFIIKELAEEFEGKVTWLRENTEKCITFSVPIEKWVTRIDKNGKK